MDHWGRVDFLNWLILLTDFKLQRMQPSNCWLDTLLLVCSSWGPGQPVDKEVYLKTLLIRQKPGNHQYGKGDKSFPPRVDSTERMGLTFFMRTNNLMSMMGMLNCGYWCRVLFKIHNGSKDTCS